jgi:ubiquinone/menaquinone biosynthesis C-methylase UbiE
MSTEEVKAHFTARAAKYDNSSHWCTDPELAARVWELLKVGSQTNVLDVACGTGLVSQWFHKRVAQVVGVDITPAMFDQAKDRLDDFKVGPGESLPVSDNEFDLVICRQGTQFMDDEAAVKEMFRACKPGGQVCIINLCAYGLDDKEEYFEVLRQRNPVRKNFYLRKDLENLMVMAGGIEVVVHDHISIEDVDAWSDNGAIPEARREAIRQVYRNGSASFLNHHAVSTESDGRFIDAMLFGIAIGTKSR